MTKCTFLRQIVVKTLTGDTLLSIAFESNHFHISCLGTSLLRALKFIVLIKTDEIQFPCYSHVSFFFDKSSTIFPHYFPLQSALISSSTTILYTSKSHPPLNYVVFSLKTYVLLQPNTYLLIIMIECVWYSETQTKHTQNIFIDLTLFMLFSMTRYGLTFKSRKDIRSVWIKYLSTCTRRFQHNEMCEFSKNNFMFGCVCVCVIIQ